MASQKNNYEPLNPVDVEIRIRELSNKIAQSVKYVSAKQREYDDAERAYKRAYAIAYTTGKGSIEDRKQNAVLATEKECQRRDVAKAALDYAKDFTRAYRDELSSYQTISAMVRQMYAVAGRGEGA
ncbi:hypothetical protein [Corynebacterium amycolatum]|uniref:hypothetical protein n=1 Tax=Corynebacterium amycolatum TaxID=43765 RepID=UPI00191F9AF9|nr:hypothetical protein [Corynebacterium amycolatum]QQU97765.1 hypothetical protein I6I65_10610 [Corynebacterium amycolatum]